jgi:flagellar motor switch protein FliM
MTEILSQEEIDALLSAISFVQASEEEYSSIGEQKKVRWYDPREPVIASNKFRIACNNASEIFTTLFIDGMKRLNFRSDHIYTNSDFTMRYNDSKSSVHYNTISEKELFNSLRDNDLFLTIHLGDEYKNDIYMVVPKLFADYLFYRSMYIKESIILDSINNDPNDLISRYKINILETTFVCILGLIRTAWSNSLDLRPRLSNLCNTINVKNLNSKEFCYMTTFPIQFSDKKIESQINILYTKNFTTYYRRYNYEFL